jgi:peptidoglycan hydrolase-like protein with peptidoglycan-binding domain
MLHHRHVALLSTVLILALLLLGCDLAGAPATIQPTAVTQAIAEPTVMVQTTPDPVAQATPNAVQPAATPTTEPPISATPTVEGCVFGASYMADITIPDDTTFEANAAFIKTWRIKNSGTCEWEAGMKLSYVSGDPLGGPPTVDVPVVALNAPVEVSVNYVAPAAPGTYRSNWRMQNSVGTQFGSTLYVQIVVPEPVVAGSTDTPPAPASPDWKVYKAGDKGTGIYALQYLLRAEGYTLDADGAFGPKTEKAVKEFQSAKGIKVDGSVGAQTWAALVQGHGVKAGKTGEDVRAVQYLLNHGYGHSEVAVDGKFGTKTDAAVRDFQTKYGLVVDGSVGANTWKALIGHLKKTFIIVPKL